MKIKMTENKKGSIDGVTVETYVAGNEYDIAESLASVFIKLNVAKEVIDMPEIIIETPEKPIKLLTSALKTKHRGRPKGSKNKRDI